MVNEQNKTSKLETILERIAKLSVNTSIVTSFVSMLLILGGAGTSEDKIRDLEILDAVGANNTPRYNQLYQEIESEKEISSQGLKYGFLGLGGSVILAYTGFFPFLLYDSYKTRKMKNDKTN